MPAQADRPLDPTRSRAADELKGSHNWHTKRGCIYSTRGHRPIQAALEAAALGARILELCELVEEGLKNGASRLGAPKMEDSDPRVGGLAVHGCRNAAAALQGFSRAGRSYSFRAMRKFQDRQNERAATACGSYRREVEA